MISFLGHIALYFAIVSIVIVELQTQMGVVLIAEVSRSAAWSSVHIEPHLYHNVSV